MKTFTWGKTTETSNGITKITVTWNDSDGNSICSGSASIATEADKTIESYARLLASKIMKDNMTLFVQEDEDSEESNV